MKFFVTQTGGHSNIILLFGRGFGEYFRSFRQPRGSIRAHRSQNIGRQTVVLWPELIVRRSLHWNSISIADVDLEGSGR